MQERRKVDPELSICKRILDLLIPLRAIQRCRVIDFIASRVDDLNNSDPAPPIMEGIGTTGNPGLFDSQGSKE